tara:strand:+ start:1360 stop:1716 length:357 start_codon:yes stop_codon:yes gene_type:complete
MDNDPDSEVRRRTRVAFCYHDLGVTLGRLLNEGQSPEQMVKAIEQSFREWKEAQERKRKPKELMFQLWERWQGFHEWKIHGLLDDIKRAEGDHDEEKNKYLLERAERLLQESLREEIE